MLASLLFAVMGMLVKLASEDMPPYQIAFARFSFGLVVAVLLRQAGLVTITAERKLLLFARGFFGCGAIIFFYIAIGGGTLTNATVFQNTYPLFATVFAVFFLRELLTPVAVIPLGAAIIGMAVMVRPEFGAVSWYDLSALLSGLLGGLAIVVIRELRKTTTAWTVFFFLSLIGTIFSGLLGFSQFVMPDPRSGLLMLLAAAVGTFAQVLNTWALKFTTAAAGSVLAMSTAVFSTVFGFAFLSERLGFWEGMGALMVVLASSLMAAGIGIKKSGSAANEVINSPE